MCSELCSLHAQVEWKRIYASSWTTRAIEASIFNDHFSLHGESFTHWNKRQTILIPTSFFFARRSQRERLRRQKTEGRRVQSSFFFFFVCPNAAPKNTSRWKALRCTDSCDCLMACICQSKEGAWRLHLKTSNKRVYFSARRLVSTFQVALIVDTRTNTSSILVSRLRSRWYL